MELSEKGVISERNTDGIVMKRGSRGDSSSLATQSSSQPWPTNCVPWASSLTTLPKRKMKRDDRLYGRETDNYQYRGMVKKSIGTRLVPDVFLAPCENIQKTKLVSKQQK